MWMKGHKPRIDDHEITDAVKTMNMMETGMQIPSDEITALEGEIMQMIKSRLNEKERQKFAEQVV
jgi:HAMP domain-containing protein